VLNRNGELLSASQERQQALSDADHLAILHAIWTAETTPARHQRCTSLLGAALPPEYRQEPTHRAKWLWRTLRTAELAGLDARQLLTDALGERDLVGARDVHAVIDARIRRRTGPLVPLPAGPWSDQLPPIADPARRAYTAQVAAMMDARKQRIGEHAATTAIPWAVSILGPVPDDPAARLTWQQRASSIGAYRELASYENPSDPIGHEPATSTPDLRAACCASLKMPMKAALTVPMWGCVEAPQPGWLRGLGGDGAGGCGRGAGYVSVTSVTAARAACSSTMAFPVA